MFLALAVLPPPVASVTGRLGQSLGDALRSWLGVGVAAVPLIPLFWAVALFGHFYRTLARRVTILLAGLAIAVPFAVGTGYQLAGVDLAAAMDNHRAPWVGQLGAALAWELRSPLGLGGEVILALAAFSALTIASSMTVCLPNQQRIFVPAAIVRWVRGQEYGVETLVVEKQTQSRLKHYVKRLV